MKVTVNKPCFVCHSTNSRLLFEKEYPSQNYPGKFAIRKCDGCGLLFNSPRLSDEQLSDLYGANYYFFQRNDLDEFRRISDVYQRTVALIQNENTEKRVAEIGSAKGYLLALLKRFGWNVQGIEISDDASEYAISKFGVPTFKGTIQDYSNSNHKDIFPVVLAIDVIEHVPNPLDFLNSIDKILSKQGILIIDTPNGNSQNIEYLGSEWKGFNPFHIYIFSSYILQLLLVNMGYSIEKCFSYGNRAENDSTNTKKFEFKQVFKSFLLRLGLLEQSKIVIRRFINLAKQQEKNYESLVSNAIQIVEKSPTYLETNDAIEDLAKTIRGDNIVVIARKIS